MIPLFLPTESPDLIMRVQRLEHALSSSLVVIQLLLQQLQSQMGPGFLGAPLERLVTSAGADVRDKVIQIDNLVRKGETPVAARLFREFAGATWDQAHTVISWWHSYSLEQKVQWLQMHQWIRALSEPGATANTDPG
jgi:hypothetical protein